MILNDKQIRQLALNGMINPYVEGGVDIATPAPWFDFPGPDKRRVPGQISSGVTSYGYDLRASGKWKIFTNAFGRVIIDPKSFDPTAFVSIEADECIIPPNSFCLAESVEVFDIPRDIIVLCIGKCLTGDAMIVDATTGDYLPIRDFVAQKRQGTISLDGWKLKSHAVTDHVCNGRQQVYELRTASGHCVKATANHPFRTMSGWTSLADLDVGDRLAVARSCPVFGKEDMPDHEATLLGLMIADGQCKTPGYSPRYTTGDGRLASVFRDCAQRFGMEVSSSGPFGHNLVNKTGRGRSSGINRASLFLRSHGADCLSIHKKIPSSIFRGNRRAVATFLRALFSGDGSVFGGDRLSVIEYYSSSEELARGVRHLLLRFGIFSRLEEKLSKSGRAAFTVRITDVDMLISFADQIGFIPGSRKQNRLESLRNRWQGRKRSNFDTLPPEAWEQFVAGARAANVSLASVGMHVNRSQSVSLKMARVAARMLGDDELISMSSPDVVWDRIKSIRALGVDEVYDLTISGPSNFLANDLVVHNSTYCRCGIALNLSPLEPEWRGVLTIEISNQTPLPAKVYANEGIGQLLFLRGEPCQYSYADKKGIYQDQKGITLPKLRS